MLVRSDGYLLPQARLRRPEYLTEAQGAGPPLVYTLIGGSCRGARNSSLCVAVVCYTKPKSSQVDCSANRSRALSCQPLMRQKFIDVRRW